MKTIKEFANEVSEAALVGTTPPPADKFDPYEFPYFVGAGGNKFGTVKCPTCGKPPMDMSDTIGANRFPNGAWQFRDKLSATEYTISGMCQACQDSVFGSEPTE